MDIRTYIKGFEDYLLLEKKLSDNSIAAYTGDVEKLQYFLSEQYPNLSLTAIQLKHCEALLLDLAETGISTRSQARFISGLKAFFHYLVIEEVINKSPVALLEAPKLSQKIPVVLSLEEIERMMSRIDQSKPDGVRNKAIIETLYGCGLRVSELLNLQISRLLFPVKLIRVIGKGDKERLVPINESAIKYITIYKNEVRNKMPIQKGEEDYLFLNRRGKRLSRVMIFMIVKDLAAKAAIHKKVSPHTFRHSFATHLYEGGANLRAIQQILGHESITTTEIYSKASQAYLKDTLIQFHPRF